MDDLSYIPKDIQTLIEQFVTCNNGHFNELDDCAYDDEPACIGYLCYKCDYGITLYEEYICNNCCCYLSSCSECQSYDIYMEECRHCKLLYCDRCNDMYECDGCSYQVCSDCKKYSRTIPGNHSFS